MKKEAKPQLCAAVIFNLLCLARRDFDAAGMDINDVRVMGGLIYLIKGENPAPTGKEQNLKSDTSNFRQCKTNGSPNLPFDKGNAQSGRYVSAFLRSLDKNYVEVHRRAAVFCNTYLNTGNSGILDMVVRSILDVMDSDGNIDDKSQFYIFPGGNTSTLKSELIKDIDNKDIELESFIIGVLRWIFENDRKNFIEKGKTERWLFQDGKNGYKMREDIGLGDDIDADFNIIFADYPDEKLEEKDNLSDEVPEEIDIEELTNDEDTDTSETSDGTNAGDIGSDDASNDQENQQMWGQGIPQIVIGVKGNNNNVANRIDTVNYMMPGDKHDE